MVAKVENLTFIFCSWNLSISWNVSATEATVTELRSFFSLSPLNRLLHLKKFATWHKKHPSWTVFRSQVLWGERRFGEAFPGIFLSCTSCHWKHRLHRCLPPLLCTIMCRWQRMAGACCRLPLPLSLLCGSSCRWPMASCCSLACRLGWGRVQDEPRRMV